MLRRKKLNNEFISKITVEIVRLSLSGANFAVSRPLSPKAIWLIIRHLKPLGYRISINRDMTVVISWSGDAKNG